MSERVWRVFEILSFACAVIWSLGGCIDQNEAADTRASAGEAAAWGSAIYFHLKANAARKQPTPPTSQTQAPE